MTRLAVTAAVILGAATAVAAPAQASVATNRAPVGTTVAQAALAAHPWVIWHVQSGRCLDGSISQGVRLNTCNGSAFQQWNTPAGSELLHEQSGRCLDGSISQGVRLNGCNGGTFQRWDNTAGLNLVHAQSRRCLDGSISQGVRLNTCNGGTFQQWEFIQV
jgi:hypothetical protein